MLRTLCTVVLYTLVAISNSSVHAQTITPSQPAAPTNFDRWKVNPSYDYLCPQGRNQDSAAFSLGTVTVTPYVRYNETQSATSFIGTFERGTKVSIPLGDNWSFTTEGSTRNSSVIRGKQLSNRRAILAYDLGNGYDFRATSSRGIVFGFAKKF